MIDTVVTYFLTYPPNELFRLLALVPILIPFRPWSVVTYAFLHGGMGHIFFNMLALFFFGPRLEQRLGGRHFLGLYFASAIAGALLSIVTPRVIIVGASGAVFGVMLGFAYYWPRDKIYIWGILPLEARLFVIILTVASLWFGFGSAAGGVAHFAHLGGFLGGFLYLKGMEHWSPARRFKRQIQTSMIKPGGDSAAIKRWEQIDRDGMHPVNREELDRVIEKIKSSGIGTLTPDERAFLDRFSPG